MKKQALSPIEFRRMVNDLANQTERELEEAWVFHQSLLKKGSGHRISYV